MCLFRNIVVLDEHPVREPSAVELHCRQVIFDHFRVDMLLVGVDRIFLHVFFRVGDQPFNLGAVLNMEKAGTLLIAEFVDDRGIMVGLDEQPDVGVFYGQFFHVRHEIAVYVDIAVDICERFYCLVLQDPRNHVEFRELDTAPSRIVP